MVCANARSSDVFRILVLGDSAARGCSGGVPWCTSVSFEDSCLGMPQVGRLCWRLFRRPFRQRRDPEAGHPIVSNRDRCHVRPQPLLSLPMPSQDVDSCSGPADLSCHAGDKKVLAASFVARALAIAGANAEADWQASPADACPPCQTLEPKESCHPPEQMSMSGKTLVAGFYLMPGMHPCSFCVFSATGS